MFPKFIKLSKPIKALHPMAKSIEVDFRASISPWMS